MRRPATFLGVVADDGVVQRPMGQAGQHGERRADRAGDVDGDDRIGRGRGPQSEAVAQRDVDGVGHGRRCIGVLLYLAIPTAQLSSPDPAGPRPLAAGVDLGAVGPLQQAWTTPPRSATPAPSGRTPGRVRYGSTRGQKVIAR